MNHSFWSFEGLTYFLQINRKQRRAYLVPMNGTSKVLVWSYQSNYDMAEKLAVRGFTQVNF